MKTIGISYARAWKYSKPSLMNKIELGKIYFFIGGSAYFHNPQIPVRLSYKHKEFFLIRKNIKIKISIYPRSLSNQKIIEWFKTWISRENILITPGGVKILLNEKAILNTQEYIYFILNIDSNAVKIGRAKDVLKRQRSLQVANPIELILLKTVQVNSNNEAKEKEKAFHDQFYDLRLIGEWFKYDEKLREFIETV
ncbi:GIY-YIG nuclease family protein [Pleurocapsa sp. FMAR1]|uniref:GIY-YIG nuclease family protein n=1 Tax=Pleurocapsa sp. FMAR1 TaxID=3040204 RepID=UPI0029C8EFE1|nr:GIY-YIG nuclease family protein [Pleurocapsa sp. FMAR1]